MSAARRAGWLRSALTALALGGGALAQWGVWAYRGEIMSLGLQLMQLHPAPETAGISSQPKLSSTFGLPGGTTRVLRLENFGGDGHLRALSFDTYGQGTWGPSQEARKTLDLETEQLHSNAPGHRVRATRLIDNRGLVFVPLRTAGISLPDGGTLDWDGPSGGPLHTDEPAPWRYEVSLGQDDKGATQGLFAPPPDAAARQRCLAVPPEVRSEVRALAQRIGGKLHDPQAKIEAVTTYLLTNHAYSLRTQRGAGDPVSNFLLEHKAAHCEYFASAAAILLRLLGVPTRYVVGYYAHETDGGAVVVRQRDAHAWNESWIDGTGWVTVDATPASGLPDAKPPGVPFWQRVQEWFQDRYHAFRYWLLGLTRQQAMLLLGLAALALMLRQWWAARQPRRVEAGEFAYHAPGADLAAVAARFETLLQRRQAAPPPHTPWAEHLTAPELQAFAHAYNAVRFGHPDDGTAVAELERMLQRLETSNLTPGPSPSQGEGSQTDPLHLN